jgi:hypothetical protein
MEMVESKIVLTIMAIGLLAVGIVIDALRLINTADIAIRLLFWFWIVSGMALMVLLHRMS